jgi:poly(3-hydroxybutyrate) depolymerase
MQGGKYLKFSPQSSIKIKFIGNFYILATSFLVAVVILLGMMGSHARAATTEVTNFGSNPGNLGMFKHVPAGLSASAPLIVVMHGCTQNARGYANEAGWVLVLPEQRKANNDNLCFNWFQAGDIERGKGEALSIRQMVDKVTADHGTDPKRTYVTGLSAGGAMTSVMLATYPDVFAGGGIVAGLPYGCARSLTDALLCMNTGHPLSGPMVGLPSSLLTPAGGTIKGLPGGAMVNLPLPPGVCMFFPLLCPSPPSGPSPGSQTFTPAQLGDFVRHASDHTGPFPIVSIWHGTSDTTVSQVNATEEMQQWTNVHGIQPVPAVQDTVKGFPHNVFKDGSGKPMVETYSITGMAHGVPVDPGSGQDQCGTADQFVLDVNVCSSLFIAKFWGLVSPSIITGSSNNQ